MLAKVRGPMRGEDTDGMGVLAAALFGATVDVYGPCAGIVRIGGEAGDGKP